MKRYYLAAGALLLGTSALALAADMDKFDKETVAVAKPMGAGVDKTMFVDKSDLAWSGDAKLQAASVDTFDKSADKLAFAEAKPKFQTASVDSFDKADIGGKLQTASVDAFDKGETEAKIQTAALDTFEPVDETLVKPADTGMGGPEETMAAANALDLTPRPATHNYPPCDPGPGDDNCIQLYEPGVRQQLASWNAPTGGLADGSSTSAMGGPYEPVDSATVVDTDPAIETASVDPMIDAHPEIETVAADPNAHMSAGDVHAGVGGPVEAQSGYPACSPGPGDDRCIQLYEPGVTGAA